MAAIKSNQIHISPGAAKHISNIFIKRLYDFNKDVMGTNPNFEQKLLNEIRLAIPKGIILSNNQSSDTHNPLDRQLEVYTYIDLSNINTNLNGIVKFTVICRLSLSNGSLSLRTIEKNFMYG